MKPRPVKEKDLLQNPFMLRASFGPPAAASFPSTLVPPDCQEVEVLVGRFAESGEEVIRIPWEIDEIDLADLAKGGTVWLTIWGRGMPPVALFVDGPSNDAREDSSADAPGE